MSSRVAEFRTYEDGMLYLEGKQSKVVGGSHTRAVLIYDPVDIEGNGVGIRYHDTVVIAFMIDGTIVLDSGGWRTVTTKKKMNVFMPNPLSVWQEKGKWYVALDDWRKPNPPVVAFEDGMHLRMGRDDKWEVK